MVTVDYHSATLARWQLLTTVQLHWEDGKGKQDLQADLEQTVDLVGSQDVGF